MIITRSPYRVSFFGGGTDYQGWYSVHGGDVLSTSINHYNYISCRYLPPFHAEYRNRIVWKILEHTSNITEIQHVAIRAALEHYGVDHGVEISNQCDLPARSGLGSSSSFCAGLIQAIYALKGEMIAKYALARETIKLERNILREQGGIQDQIAAVYGGLNHIHINHNGSFSVEPIIMDDERKCIFNQHLLLFFTGVARDSSDVAQKQVENAAAKTSQLLQMQAMVTEACGILSDGGKNLDDFGHLLHETWLLKRSLAKSISNSFIDEIYSTAIQQGALGGKILGAGGGGFILFYAKPEGHQRIKGALQRLIHVPFKFDDQGTQIILYSPKQYPSSTYERLDYIHMQQNHCNIKY